MRSQGCSPFLHSESLSLLCRAPVELWVGFHKGVPGWATFPHLAWLRSWCLASASLNLLCVYLLPWYTPNKGCRSVSCTFVLAVPENMKNKLVKESLHPLLWNPEATSFIMILRVSHFQPHFLTSSPCHL